VLNYTEESNSRYTLMMQTEDDRNREAGQPAPKHGRQVRLPTPDYAERIRSGHDPLLCVGRCCMQRSNNLSSSSSPPLSPYPVPANGGYLQDIVTTPPVSLPSPPIKTELSHSSEKTFPPSMIYVFSKEEISKNGDSLCYEIGNSDVLCGTGGAPKSWHPGNQIMIHLIEKYQQRYMVDSHTDRLRLAVDIVKYIRQRGGRFLQRTEMAILAPSYEDGMPIYGWRKMSSGSACKMVCQVLGKRRRQLAEEGAKFKKMRVAATSHTFSDAEYK